MLLPVIDHRAFRSDLTNRMNAALPSSKRSVRRLSDSSNRKALPHFISGMALGVDMYAAEIVLGLKSSYEGITLESAIPCESQAEKWTEKQRDRYFEIASKCDKETLIQHHYTSDCMHKRNRYMVDQADFIIAVWDGRPSGTGKTVQYAQRQGKLVTIINPRTMLVE